MTSRRIDSSRQSIHDFNGYLAGNPLKDYAREFLGFRDISFECKKGETVGIIGRNGSGKSTLLQIVVRDFSCDIGVIETHGRVAALLELGAGFNPDFTGRENVYMNATILGLNQARDRRSSSMTSPPLRISENSSSSP